MSESAQASEKVPASVLIPTKNEERNLPTTLDRLGWVDEIIVFDSLSTDNTLAIAKNYGATVFQREFDNFADHKNWALDHLPFRNDWILILDADEQVPEDLEHEIRRICAAPPLFDAYAIARRIYVDGVWLRRAGKYPDYQIRLFRKGKARYERRIVHEHMVVDGKTGVLRASLVHIDKKGARRYIERHNHYAEMEAVEAYIARHSPQQGQGSSPRGRLSRRQLKDFAYRYLPFRPALVFIYLYVFRLGFLMGHAGLKTCALRTFYEYMIDLYLEELEDRLSPTYEKYCAYIEERYGEKRLANKI
jgi:glycosyltransferase involved in cell wall biosynthesis